ncbi:uncharacterized protein LOC132311170 [Cornus florida]|uniref:uncharacterized protein LOC132311170 n=1 Tax=Cornus florida TaxID=4283 RepID=UPI00289DB2EE|nr:uncharacterized protein LOC132311170 [Cornus florida]
MLGLIETQGLLAFINGEVSAPPERIIVPEDGENVVVPDNVVTYANADGDSCIIYTKMIDNQHYQDWKRSDQLLLTWIKETINEDVLRSVECCKTAKDMWSNIIILRERKIDCPHGAVGVKVTDFVPMKLSSSDNYCTWKTWMLRFIENQGMLGFINGEVSKPTFSDQNNSSNNNDEWRKSDEQLQRWMKETMSEDICQELVRLETSKDIWETLITLHETNVVYPYPVEVNMPDSVPLKLSRSNYVVWRRQMLGLFRNEGLLGFILPQKKIIPRAVPLAWKRTDALLKSWVIKTINENLVAYVVDLETARDMWTKLEAEFTYGKGSSTETIFEYPYPEEANVGDFVPIKLSTETSSLWEDLMFSLIERHGLVGFINGKIPAPPKGIRIADESNSQNMVYKNPDYMAWKRTDQLLQSWIVGTINQDLLPCLVNLETAQEIWTKLYKLFDFGFHIYESTETDEETEEDPISKYVSLH